MHDGPDMWPHAVNPEMKAVGRVRHPVAFEHVQVVVHQQEIVRPNLVKAEAEAQHVICARRVATGGRLARKSGIVPFGGEDAAGESELLTRRPVRYCEVPVHPLAGLAVICVLVPGDNVHDVLTYEHCPDT
jgi:hypothetical protein